MLVQGSRTAGSDAARRPGAGRRLGRGRRDHRRLGLRLSAAAPPEARPPHRRSRPCKTRRRPPATRRPRGRRSLHGDGRDKDTGSRSPGPTVVVRRSVYSGTRTGCSRRPGTPPRRRHVHPQIPAGAGRRAPLYIELDVEHPATPPGPVRLLPGDDPEERDARRAPLLRDHRDAPGEPITGRVETPEGEPAEGVELLAYSRTDKLPKGEYEYGSFARTKTDAEGRFRLPITTPGRAVYWVLPRAYAPELYLLADGKRGDLGTITLRKGRDRDRPGFRRPRASRCRACSSRPTGSAGAGRSSRRSES
jgi:hypothetical protein